MMNIVSEAEKEGTFLVAIIDVIFYLVITYEDRCFIVVEKYRHREGCVCVGRVRSSE